MIAAVPGLALIAIYAAWHIIRDRAAIKAASRLTGQVTAELADFTAWDEEMTAR